MRCAILFNETQALEEQEIMAWGENQSLEEEPAYKESDILASEHSDYFKGYKRALDDVCATLEGLADEGVLKSYQSDEMQRRMSGTLCMMLFGILDSEEYSEEDE